MNRLLVVKILNADGLLERLSGGELRLFLLMIAKCGKKGEGELHGEEIRRFCGRGLTQRQLEGLCAKLEAMAPRLRFGAEYDGLVVTYYIRFAA